MGEPMPWAIQGMTRLKQRGHTIIIHTVRGNHPKHVADWLDFFKIPYDQVTDVKPNADCFIDDKAVTFRGWDKLIADTYEMLGIEI